MVPNHLLQYLNENKPGITSSEKSIEIVYILLILYQCFSLFTNYPSLPDTIAIHFNIDGIPDGFGGKEILLLFPTLSVVLYGIFSMARYFPQFINVPWKLTKENLIPQIKLVQRFLLVLKGEMLMLFTILAIDMIEIGLGQQEKLSTLFLIIVLSLPVTLSWYFIQGYKSK